MPRTHEPGGRARKNSGSINIAPGTFKPILRRRNRIGEQFAPRTISMLESPAFCALSLSARRVLDRLEIELASHGGRDNGQLPLTYAQLEAYGLHKDAIAPAIRECVALGFVEVTQRGRASSTAEYRHPSKYRLTYRPTEHGVVSHEWRRIKSEEEAETRARTARQSPPKKQNATPGNRGRTYPRKPWVRVDQTLPPETMGTGQPRKPWVPLYSQGDRPNTEDERGRGDGLMSYVAGVIRQQIDEYC
jgi:hypothetical protein